MTIMTRLVRLFKADVYGVMDQLEDKGLLLRQYLREMETNLEQKDAQLRVLSEGMDRLSANMERQTAEIKKLDQDVDLALTKEKDDIARLLIRRRLALEAAANHLEKQILGASQEKASLVETIRNQKLQYETFKGSRKNNFTFFMVRSNSSNLVVEYIVPSLFDSFVGQRPSYLYGNFSC